MLLHHGRPSTAQHSTAQHIPPTLSAHPRLAQRTTAAPPPPPTPPLPTHPSLPLLHAQPVAAFLDVLTSLWPAPSERACTASLHRSDRCASLPTSPVLIYPAQPTPLQVNSQTASSRGPPLALLAPRFGRQHIPVRAHYLATYPSLLQVLSFPSCLLARVREPFKLSSEFLYQHRSPRLSPPSRPPPSDESALSRAGGLSPLLAHVTRFFLPAQLCSILARPVALFAGQHHGRPQRPAAVAPATAVCRLSLAALVSLALDAAHLLIPSAARAAACRRALPRLTAGRKHVAAAAQPASHTSPGRPTTTTTPRSTTTTAPPTTHGLSTPTTTTRNAAILSASRPSSTRPADEYGQHGARSVQRDALPATAPRRHARPFWRPPQEGNQATHENRMFDLSQKKNKGECGVQWHAIGRRDVETRGERSLFPRTRNREPP